MDPNHALSTPTLNGTSVPTSTSPTSDPSPSPAPSLTSASVIPAAAAAMPSTAPSTDTNTDGVEKHSSSTGVDTTGDLDIIKEYASMVPTGTLKFAASLASSGMNTIRNAKASKSKLLKNQLPIQQKDGHQIPQSSRNFKHMLQPTNAAVHSNATTSSTTSSSSPLISPSVSAAPASSSTQRSKLVKSSLISPSASASTSTSAAANQQLKRSLLRTNISNSNSRHGTATSASLAAHAAAQVPPTNPSPTPITPGSSVAASTSHFEHSHPQNDGEYIHVLQQQITKLQTELERVKDKEKPTTTTTTGASSSIRASNLSPHSHTRTNSAATLSHNEIQRIRMENIQLKRQIQSSLKHTPSMTSSASRSNLSSRSTTNNANDSSSTLSSPTSSKPGSRRSSNRNTVASPPSSAAHANNPPPRLNVDPSDSGNDGASTRTSTSSTINSISSNNKLVNVSTGVEKAFNKRLAVKQGMERSRSLRTPLYTEHKHASKPSNQQQSSARVTASSATTSSNAPDASTSTQSITCTSPSAKQSHDTDGSSTTVASTTSVPSHDSRSHHFQQVSKKLNGNHQKFQTLPPMSQSRLNTPLIASISKTSSAGGSPVSSHHHPHLPHTPTIQRISSHFITSSPSASRRNVMNGNTNSVNALGGFVLDAEILKYQQQVLDKDNEIMTLRKELSESITVRQSSQSQHNDEIDRWSKRVEQLQDLVLTYQEKHDLHQKNVNELLQQIAGCNSKYQDAQHELNRAEASNASLTAMSNALQESIIHLQQENARLELESSRSQQHSRWQQAKSNKNIHAECISEIEDLKFQLYYGYKRHDAQDNESESESDKESTRDINDSDGDSDHHESENESIHVSDGSSDSEEEMGLVLTIH